MFYISRVRRWGFFGENLWMMKRAVIIDKRILATETEIIGSSS